MELIHVKPMLYDQKWMYDVEVRNVARGLINEKSEKLIVPDDDNVISFIIKYEPLIFVDYSIIEDVHQGEVESIDKLVMQVDEIFETIFSICNHPTFEDMINPQDQVWDLIDDYDK